jgi:hypothetical protein
MTVKRIVPEKKTANKTSSINVFVCNLSVENIVVSFLAFMIDVHDPDLSGRKHADAHLHSFLIGRGETRMSIRFASVCGFAVFRISQVRRTGWSGQVCTFSDLLFWSGSSWWERG